MTKTSTASPIIIDLAYYAITGAIATSDGRPTHITVAAVCKALKLNTEQAVAVRQMIRNDWLASEHLTYRNDALKVALDTLNSYANNRLWI